MNETMKDEKFLHLKPEGGILRHGSLFSGIGGFDLAAEWMGWENVFHCEWNEFGQKILKHYWPNAISYTDITKTDFTIHRGNIDILTGGFPCQPYSTAGKRKGKEDERHLWPEMLRAIREIQPTYIVAENVSGLINWNGGLVFDEVQSNMENEGYEGTPFLLPACAINAPHRRERVWFIAYSTSNRWTRQRKKSENENGKERSEEVRELEGRFEGLRKDGATSNCSNSRTKNIRRKWKDSILKPEFATNAKNERLQERYAEQVQLTTHTTIKRHSGFSRWENFPTQSPVCGGDDGIPRELDGITFPKWRTESIKGYGNAIVPELAFCIFRAVGVLNAKNLRR